MFDNQVNKQSELYSQKKISWASAKGHKGTCLLIFLDTVTVRSDATYGKTDEQLIAPKNITEVYWTKYVEQILLVLSET